MLHETARQYQWKGVGQLSIKSFFGGRAHYQVGCAYHAVDESSYLILNEGQTYAIDIQSREPVESFCLFFAPGFVEEAWRSLSCKTERLLDEPESGRATPTQIFEKNYAHDRILSPVLLKLRKTYRNRESGLLLEDLHGIVEQLLRVHEATRNETERLNNVRLATREELYRRVGRARDYAHALFAQPIILAELSRVACLSPNHLLRSFRAIFGQTPHEFLRERRLSEASTFLRALTCRSRKSV